MGVEERELREIKEALVTRKEELKRELKRLEALISLIDEKLGAAPTPTVEERPAAPPKRLALAVWGNRVVAEATIYPDKLEIAVSKDFKIPVSASPVYNFLVRKVLDSYSAEDMEKVNRGELDGKRALRYSLSQDDEGNLRKVVVVNYGDTARLSDILRKTKWAFLTVVKESAGAAKGLR